MMVVIIGVIEVLTMTEVDLGLKIPATIPLKIWKKLLMVIGEVGISPRQATLPPITHVTILNFCVYLLILVMLVIFFMTI